MLWPLLQCSKLPVSQFRDGTFCTIIGPSIHVLFSYNIPRISSMWPTCRNHSKTVNGHLKKKDGLYRVKDWLVGLQPWDADFCPTLFLLLLLITRHPVASTQRVLVNATWLRNRAEEKGDRVNGAATRQTSHVARTAALWLRRLFHSNIWMYQNIKSDVYANDLEFSALLLSNPQVENVDGDKWRVFICLLF